MLLVKDQIDRLLDAVAEHKPVHWETELQRARNADERELVEQLRTVQLVTTSPQEITDLLEATGEFKVVRELGRGSMGIVYEAVQLALDRHVALKVLPPEMTVNPKRLERFEREAKTLARLDHANLVTVHNVESIGDVHFLTMELVKGEPLARRIPKSGLALDSFLELAIPMADALSAAHEHEITHRDIKPANIMITAERRVKILDFGLAKLRHADPSPAPEIGPEGPISITQQGAVVGTLPYMSPEQVEGKSIDSRSDLFSLGVVFYEMLTGRRPFEGDTPAQVTSKVLRETPPSVLEIRSDLPPDLGRIVRHCMQKDPERRAQTAKGLRNELEELKTDLLVKPPTPGPAPEPEVIGKKQVFAYSVSVLALVLAAALGGLWIKELIENNRRLPTWASSQLTSDPGWEAEPVVSPDGKQIAYASQWGENVDIWLTEASGGAVLRLTTDRALDRSPAWFPDGSTLAFVSNRNGTDSVWKISRLGGFPSLVVPNAVDPAISPDGTRIAFARPGSSNCRRICVAPLEDPSRVTVLTDDDGGLWDHKNPAWSPDGSELVYAAYRDLWVVPAAGGMPRRLTWDNHRSRNPTWPTDGRFVYFDSSREGTRALWRVRNDGKRLARVTLGSGPETHPSVSSDGSLLTYSTFHRDPNLAVLDLVSGERVAIRGTRSESSVALAPDASTLVFGSNRAGNYNLWTQRLVEGRPDGEPQQLTHHEGRAEHPDVSPDGRWIAYGRVEGEQHDIWIVPLAGGLRRQFTGNPGVDLQPSWSPDGSRLAFVSERDGKEHVWVADVHEGLPIGEPVQITTGESDDRFPAWSPDGRRIAYVSANQNRRDVWVQDVEGSDAPRRLTSGVRARYVRWDPSGESLWVSATWGSDYLEIRRVDLADGSIRSFSPPLVIGAASGEEIFALSSDAELLVFVEDDPRGDIWKLSVKKGSF